jgi:CRISPR-associated endonuclease Csn1
MKKILGLDLGVTSIGWALIETDESAKPIHIIAKGSRIVPLSADDKDEFSQGNAISKNQKRTLRRTQRKGYDRHQLRRKSLTNGLLQKQMFDGKLFQLKPLELWGLRARGVNERIELTELGRVLYHLNQKRGYKSSRSDANLDKKDTDYVAEVKGRHQEIRELGITIGQKFYNELEKDQYYRIKQQVFPREAYIEEFEAICKQQQKHYPQIITDDFIARLRDEIIYFQRKLKSQKNLVSFCDFEGFWTKDKAGKEIFTGPKVAPKSSPLFQVCKIWESINTIVIKDKRGEAFEITLEKKEELFNYLDNNEKLTSAKLFEILELKKNDFYTNKQIERGIQGNLAKTQILNAVKDGEFNKELLQFKLTIKPSDKEVFLVDRKTGEITNSKQFKIIDEDVDQQPLYKLWHTIYSIADVQECMNALVKSFGIEKPIAEKLANIDLTKQAFGNKSAKSMRKILPYLMEGNVYSDACSYAGYNHSNSLTKDENEKRKLLDNIPLLPKNSLRQPVVEKILNQMINIVNAINTSYGRPYEIRVELARELKQSKEERNETFANLNKRERENQIIRKRITEEYNLRATRNSVIKWRLYHEINNEESKQNAICIYCGKQFGLTDALRGDNVDVEHIIPKSLLFDDSQSNKTLSHRSCNEAKGNKTAYDFMETKSEDEFNAYLERVNSLYKNKIIGRTKRDKLLMPEAKIPKDFIERQLRQTQYIARKSKEILEQVCTNVWSTSGSVTEYLRRVWGWDDVLMNLQLPSYRELGLTEWREWETNDGQKHKQEVIKNWSKRDDHRHHAIDALVIACTQQGFIQRINNLSSKGNRDEMYSEVGKTKKGTLLENYLAAQRPFNTKEVEAKASEILISFKAGKKVATLGTRKIKKNGKKQIVQKGIIVPRGALSEESVYGKIKTIERKKPLKYLFENPDLIFNDRIRKLVKERLANHANDSKISLASLKNDPIYLNEEKRIRLEYATCYKEEVVLKYPVETIKVKDIEYIIDEKVKAIVKARLEQFGNREKEAFRTPLYFNEEKKIPIKTVRMSTNLSSIEPVKKDNKGKNIGFVKPGNNHHIAFYIDESGMKHEHLCTFWHGVERKKYNLPIVIKEPKKVWDSILNEKNKYLEEFLQKLPSDKWSLVESLQQNEMFILGLSEVDFNDFTQRNDYSLLSKHLYRTQKLSMKGNGQIDLWFRHHLETEINDSSEAKLSKRFYNVQSIGAFENLNPKKVFVTNLGEIKRV